MAGVFNQTRGDRPSLLNPTDEGPYRSHVRDVVRSFNRAFRANGLPLKATDRGVTFEHTLRKKFARGRYEEDRFGRVWDTQINTYAEVLVKCHANPGQNGVVIGSTMCGKTGTANLCYALGPHLYALTGRKHVVVHLLPNKTNIEAQTRQERQLFMALYGQVRFANIRHPEIGSISIEEYYTDDEILDFDETLYAPFDADGSNASLTRRSNGQQKKRIFDLVERARELNITLIFVIDEVHHGSQTNSLQGKMLRYARMLQKGGGNFFIGVSATAWPLSAPKNLWRVRHRLSKGYVGFNMFDGKVLDPTVETRIPDYVSYREFSEQYNIPDGHIIHRAAYRSERSWLALRSDDSDSHDEYRDRYERWVANVINLLLVEENPRKGKVLIARLFVSNDETRDFWRAITRKGYLSPKIQSLQFMLPNSEGKDIRRLVRDHRAKHGDGPLAILVTGNGRMADNFPKDTKYMLDLTAYSNWSALIQSAGRITGNDKGEGELPVGVFSPQNVCEIRNYVARKGAPQKKPHPGTVVVDSGGEQRGHPAQSIFIPSEVMAHAKLWNLRQFAERLCEDLYPVSESTKILGNPKPCRRHRGEVPIYRHLTDNVFDFLEGNLETLLDLRYEPKLKLLRPGMEDWKRYSYRRTGKSIGDIATGMGHVTVRSIQALGRGRGQRSTNFRSKTGNSESLEPQIVVTANSKTDRWEFQGVRLRTVKPIVVAVRDLSKVEGGKTFPDDTLYAHELLTPEEKRLVSNYKGLTWKERRAG